MQGSLLSETSPVGGSLVRRACGAGRGPRRRARPTHRCSHAQPSPLPGLAAHARMDQRPAFDWSYELPRSAIFARHARIGRQGSCHRPGTGSRPPTRACGADRCRLRPGPRPARAGHCAWSYSAIARQSEAPARQIARARHQLHRCNGCRGAAVMERGRPPQASITSRTTDPSPAGNRAPRMSTTGRRLVLPDASSATEANSSATATTVARIVRPSVSGRPRMSSSGSKPATPRATSVMPRRHGRPNESLTMMATGTPSSDPKRPCDRTCRAIGILGKQRHDVRVAHVGGVDPGVGTDVALLRAADDDAMLHAHDPGRLAQHDFDLPSVLLPGGGKGTGLWARFDIGEVHDAALGLGNDLLRNHEHVAEPRRELGLRPRPAGAMRRRSRQPGHRLDGPRAARAERWR